MVKRDEELEAREHLILKIMRGHGDGMRRRSQTES